MNVITDRKLYVKAEPDSGFINTRGIAGNLSLSESENNPQVYKGKNAGAYVQGTGSIYIGINSGYNSNGSRNVAIGYNSSYSNTGSYNTISGYYSGYSSTGSYNIDVGYYSGANRSGNSSVLIGWSAGLNSNTDECVSIGLQTVAGDVSGNSRNVYIGLRAGEKISTGTNNVIIGGNTGRNTTSGKNNCFVGRNISLNNATGSNNICIGNFSNTNNILNGILVGNSSNVTSSSGIGIGNSLTTNAPGLFIKPVRSSTSGTDTRLIYDTTTSEINYSTSKTFIIDHPIDSSKYLVHVCLEGPESGVYYRGKGEILQNDECKVELPLYVRFATDFTVNIMPIGPLRVMSCSEVIKPESPTEQVYFYVYGTGRFYWNLYGKREDIQVEYDKQTGVNGSGPYKWIE